MADDAHALVLRPGAPAGLTLMVRAPEPDPHGEDLMLPVKFLIRDYAGTVVHTSMETFLATPASVEGSIITRRVTFGEDEATMLALVMAGRDGTWEAISDCGCVVMDRGPVRAVVVPYRQDRIPSGCCGDSGKIHTVPVPVPSKDRGRHGPFSRAFQ